MSPAGPIPSASSTPSTDLPASGDNGDSRASMVIVASVIFWLIGTAAVALRFYTRAKIVRVLGAEDWTIVVSLIFSTGVSIIQITMTKYGWGTHVWMIASDEWVPIAKLTLALLQSYQISLSVTKISILVLYRRMLTFHHARWAVYALMAIVVVYNLWGLISELTVCTPLEKLWDADNYDACHPASSTWASVGLHIGTDFLIFLLPIPVFYKLTIPPREKVTIIGLFSLGFVACIISILRAIELGQQLESPDMTWDFIPVSVWNVTEVNVAILCACAMTYKPLIAKFWPGWFLPPKPEKPGEVTPSESGK